MSYFIATVLRKGKKEEIGLYATDRKEANNYAKLKFTGIIIKVVEGQEPLEAQFKRIKNDLMKNVRKRKIKQCSKSFCSIIWKI